MAHPAVRKDWAFAELAEGMSPEAQRRHSPASLFDQPGKAFIANDASRWAGINVLKSPWRGYFRLQMVDQDLVSRAYVDVHHGEIEKFRDGAEALRRGRPVTIQLSQLAEFAAAGQTAHARALLLEPGARNGKVSIISDKFETMWRGEIRPLQLAQVLSEISREALQIAESAPRRSLASPPRQAMPEAWSQHALRQGEAASNARAFASDGVSVELRGAPVHLPGAAVVGASKLEIRVDDWPPMLEIEYVTGGTTRRYAREFKPDDLQVMQSSLRDRTWRLAADDPLTMDLKSAQRPAVYEAIHGVMAVYGDRFLPSLPRHATPAPPEDRVWM